MNELPDLHKSYEQGKLSEGLAARETAVQLRQWRNHPLAAKFPEPDAMTLATVGRDTRPCTRAALIKGGDVQGLACFTAYNSRKSQKRPAP